jgi:hypothetical protein
MSEETFYSGPGGIQFETATLANWDRSKLLDIRPIIIEFNIHESLRKPFVTASFVISDALALTTSFPIVGQETLELKFKTPGNSFLKPVEVTFRVISIKEFKRSEIREVAYILNCVTAPMITDMNTRVRKAYKEQSIDEMVNDIMVNFLGDQFEQIDPTDGNRTFVIPNMSPSNAINFLARKAKSATYQSSPYFFYQTCDGFFFRTSNDMISPKARKGLAIDKYFGADFQFSKGVSPRDSSTTGGGGAARQSSKPYEFLKIRDFNFHNMANLYASLLAGALENKVNFYDPIMDFYEEKTYNYLKDNDSFLKTTSGTQGLFLTDTNDYIKGGDSFTLFEPTNHTQQNEYSPDKDYDILNKKIGAQNIFENLMATVVIPGDTEKRTGQLVNLAFPEYGATEDVIGKLNKFASGEFLIVSLQHKYNAQGYFTMMTVSKNSYEQDIHDNTDITFTKSQLDEKNK